MYTTSLYKRQQFIRLAMVFILIPVFTCTARAKSDQVNKTASVTSAKNSSQNSLYSQTRPDNTASAESQKPLDSPAATVGQGWKMLVLLLPTLLIIVGVLNLLKKYQVRNGTLPSFLKSSGTQNKSSGMAGWMSLAGDSLKRMRQPERAGHMRLVETLPVGGQQIAIVNVGERSLLLSVSGSGISLLTELNLNQNDSAKEFRSLLHATNTDSGDLNLTDDLSTAAVMLDDMDDLLMDTDSALARSLNRLRMQRHMEDME